MCRGQDPGTGRRRHGQRELLKERTESYKPVNRKNFHPGTKPPTTVTSRQKLQGLEKGT